MKQIHILLLMAMPMLVFGQIQYRGSIHPYNLYRISNGSEISLPFRFSELHLDITVGDFDFKTSSAIEYRWSTGESEFDLREAYLVWYPSFGEVRLGKQIHTWGAADGNNPTDNLNAYDYYYLFLPGTDRKIGSLSVGGTLYHGDWQVDAILTPEHQPDRMPFGEKDFPIGPPFEPEKYIKIDNPLEYGLRVQTTLGQNDISVSYFKGHDRGFSPHTKVLAPIDTTGTVWVWGEIPYKFGYRSTKVFGMDLVSFWSDFTIREEVAYFLTKTEGDHNMPLSGKYIQYVFQIEYNSPLDITIITQLIGNKNLRIDDDSTPIDFDITNPPSVFPDEARWDNKENFHAGMGTPFAMFAERGLFLSALANLMDDRLELLATGFKSLDEAGLMIGFGATYSPIENWGLEFSINQFIGDEDDPENVFTRLEDFSYILFGLKYSY